MRRWVFTALLLALAMLTFPLAAGAGWAGSLYKKSECTYTKETNFLFCETTVMLETFTTEHRSFPDASCPSGTRGVDRTGTLVEPSRLTDTYAGPVPHAKWHLDHELAQLIGQEFWKDFTDTDTGCD